MKFAEIINQLRRDRLCNIERGSPDRIESGKEVFVFRVENTNKCFQAVFVLKLMLPYITQ